LSILPFYPLITVVIPTYNRGLLLRKAVASVLAQTYTHWELIVVDDGSTDDTAEIIHSLKDSGILLLALPHSGNIASLRNAGAKKGSGEWIAFLDSDDEWVSNKLEIQLHLLLEKKKLWSYGGYELMDEVSKTIGYKSGIFRPVSGWIARPLITTEVAVNIGSLMVHRKLFHDVGGFNTEPKLLYREDYELALRLSLKAEALAVPDLLVRIREHTSRTTNAFDDGHERTAFVYEHFLNSRPGNKLERLARRRMAYHLAEIAVNCIEKGKYFPAVHQLAKALVHRDRLRHLLSVIRRGSLARYKRIQKK
jgi:glycosyltransferase involved in cell wall biosynthesis